MRFIGDVHGKMDGYLEIISSCESSVQIGDFGAGFVELPEVSKNHRVIRGNHDSPSVIKKYPNYISDGYIENGIMFIGGAWSIDWQYRVPGLTWWEDEECSIEELQGFIDSAQMHKPRIIVSHDCPSSVAKTMFLEGTHKPVYPTRTGQAFDFLFSAYKPEIWVFGHWHQNQVNKIENTYFICLNELSYIDIEF
jgi:predicted phosphodiesterase